MTINVGTKVSEWVNIALHRFLHNYGNIVTEGSPKSGPCPTLISNDFKGYSAQYHRQHCTLQAFEQFGALYAHNHDDKYLARPAFEPGTSRLQPPVDTNEPSGPAFIYKKSQIAGCYFLKIEY